MSKKMKMGEKVVITKLVVNTGENAMYGWSECGNCGYELKEDDSRVECAKCGAFFEDIKHNSYDFGGSDF